MMYTFNGEAPLATNVQFAIDAINGLDAHIYSLEARLAELEKRLENAVTEPTPVLHTGTGEQSA